MQLASDWLFNKRRYATCFSKLRELVF